MCICSTILVFSQINTNFNVWVLPSSRENSKNGELRLPDIGGDDPSVRHLLYPFFNESEAIETSSLTGPSQVIYVKPGYEANLDSLVQDTIRLTLSVKVINQGDT